MLHLIDKMSVVLVDGDIIILRVTNKTSLHKGTLYTQNHNRDKAKWNSEICLTNTEGRKRRKNKRCKQKPEGKKTKM